MFNATLDNRMTRTQIHICAKDIKQDYNDWLPSLADKAVENDIFMLNKKSIILF